MSAKRQSRGNHERRLPAYLLVLALVLLDIPLVAFALNAAQHDEGDTPAASSPTSSAPAAPVDSPTSAPVVEDVPAFERLLASAGGGVLWRAETGSCAAGGATVEVSTDEGVTWTEVSLRAGPPIAQVLGIVTGPDSLQASVIYADTSCLATVQRTFSGGAGWQDNAALLAVGTFVAGDGSLTIAGRATAPPCSHPLAAPSPNAVLCADGLYVGESGAWSGPIVGVRAVAPFDATRTLAALAAEDGCEGVPVATIDRGGIVTRVACVEVDPADAVAIAADDGAAWVWSGTQTVSVEVPS